MKAMPAEAARSHGGSCVNSLYYFSWATQGREADIPNPNTNIHVFFWDIEVDLN